MLVLMMLRHALRPSCLETAFAQSEQGQIFWKSVNDGMAFWFLIFSLGTGIALLIMLIQGAVALAGGA